MLAQLVILVKLEGIFGEMWPSNSMVTLDMQLGEGVLITFMLQDIQEKTTHIYRPLFQGQYNLRVTLHKLCHKYLYSEFIVLLP